MTARTSHKTEAIVLRRFDYGESDWIVTFYTSDFGKFGELPRGPAEVRRDLPIHWNCQLFPYPFLSSGQGGLALIETVASAATIRTSEKIWIKP